MPKNRDFGPESAKSLDVRGLKTHISKRFWDSFEIQTAYGMEKTILKRTCIGYLIVERIFRCNEIYDKKSTKNAPEMVETEHILGVASG